jgi:type I restriction enzyme, S subunit
VTAHVEEHPWLQSVPSDWRVARLKATVAFSQNGLWGEEPDGVNDIVCVRVADFDRVRCRVVLDDPTTRAVPAAKIGRRLLKRGDLLIEKSGGGEHQPVGTVVKYDHEVRAVCSNFVARIEPKAEFDSGFLCYLHAALYVLRIPHRSIKQTTGIQNLDAESYFNEPVPLPPPKLQRKIASFLDRKTAAIDALIAKKERLIELLQEKRQALITQAVTKGLDPTAPMKESGVQWLGAIPAHWTIRRLKHFFSFSKGRNAQQLTATYIAEHPGEFPVYSGQTEDGGVMGRIDAAEYDLPEVIFTTTVGAKVMTSRVVGGQFSLSQNCLIMVPRNDSVSVRFFNHQLVPLFRFQRASIPDHMQPSLRVSDLLKFDVACPPPDEQRKISEHIDLVSLSDERTGALVEQQIEKLREYRQAVITAAVTGKIDVSKEAA